MTFNFIQLCCAEDEHELTCVEENLGAVIMLPCTGYMKRRPIVAVVGLHESSLIDHELNTIWITYCERQAKLNDLHESGFQSMAGEQNPRRDKSRFEKCQLIEILHPKFCLLSIQHSFPVGFKGGCVLSSFRVQHLLTSYFCFQINTAIIWVCPSGLASTAHLCPIVLLVIVSLSFCFIATFWKTFK